MDLVADLKAADTEKLERLLSGDFCVDADMIRDAMFQKHIDETLVAEVGNGHLVNEMSTNDRGFLLGSEMTTGLLAHGLGISSHGSPGESRFD